MNLYAAIQITENQFRPPWLPELILFAINKKGKAVQIHTIITGDRVSYSALMSNERAEGEITRQDFIALIESAPIYPYRWNDTVTEITPEICTTARAYYREVYSI